MTNRAELHDKITGDIKGRSRWEQRQSLWYEMRHTGLRRKNKPWNNASDLHFPLSDSVVERLKPFYYMQIVGMDTIASFIPMRQQDGGLTVTAERWFDYKIKESTNFLSEGLTWIDHGLMSGRSVVKVYWDAQKKKVQYDAIDPMMIVVPEKTRNLQESERVVNIMQMSVDSFKSNPLYSGVDVNEIQSKRGKVGNSNEKEVNTYRREGINYSSDLNRIILWEVYEKKDGKVFVQTFCPEVASMDVRPIMELDYNHGSYPFVDFSYEIKDKGWYSPRGVCEILAPFESSLCKMWNEKHDAMTLYNRPMFKTDRDIPNSSNIRLSPAQILPVGLAPVQMSSPPISWDQEIEMTRYIAEQRIGMPDFGVQSMQNKGDRRTATEINAISGLMAESNDLRARVFRLSLGSLYRQSWNLYLQYNKEDLDFRYREDNGRIEPEAFMGDYVIEPKGGPDSQNRALKLQQAMQRKQLFAGSPFINQAELDRSILELDDPSLVRRMFLDPQMRQQHEGLEEANNIGIMETGFPVPVRGDENFEIRIGVLVQYLDQKMGSGEGISEQTQQLIVMRISELLDAYEQANPNAARQLRKQLADSAASLAEERQMGALPDGEEGQQQMPQREERL
tara:strand:- start:5058 stop:6920 length:1863 start_codon:yes stop_codon:yes gene_type:complete